MKKSTLFIALLFIVTFAFSQATPLTEAVDFTATDFNGVEHNLFDILDGDQYVCIDFFYTDCSPCTADLPFLIEAYELFGCNNADVFFISISLVHDIDADLIEYWEEHGIQHPGISAIDGGGSAICATYQIGITPTYTLVAPNRDIVEQGIYPINSTQDFINAFESNGLQQATCTTGLDELSEEQISIYPNPTTGDFELKFKHNGNANIKLINLLGVTIYEESISASGEFSKKMNLNGFDNGIYFITVQTEDKTQVKKIKLIK